MEDEPAVKLTMADEEVIGQDDKLHEYFCAIASARYFIRMLFRQIDEQVRRLGLDPLAHQALIQVFGSPEVRLSISELAERLDVGLDVASKVVSSLQTKGYVVRQQSLRDRRVIDVRATRAGRSFLTTVDGHVQKIVDDMQPHITEDIRQAVSSIFSFYLGSKLEIHSAHDGTGRAAPSRPTRGSPAAGRRRRRG